MDDFGQRHHVRQHQHLVRACGRDIGVDVGSYVDLVDSVEDDWMDSDVTEAVQGALANSQNFVSLMVYTSSQTTDEIIFTSTEGSASDVPTSR